MNLIFCMKRRIKVSLKQIPLLLVATIRHVQSTQNIIFAVSLEPLAHLRNVASLILFFRYFFGKCSSELAQLLRLLFLLVGLLVILIDCMIFPSPFLDVTRMSMSTVSFLAQLGSACRMLSFDLCS